MVKKYLLSISTALILILSFTSCDKWIDSDLNNDPDGATEVTNSLLLSAIQLDMGYVLGSQDVIGTTGMWVQYSRGSARQAGIIGSYNITESDINNLWNSMYNGGMMDTYVLLQQTAGEDGFRGYSGAAKVLMAVYLGYATDLWGDIPYTEAFLGLENFNPAYDSQESIYAAIQSLLSEAITELGAVSGPIENDMIFGGSKSKWIKTAYSLKARYAIHLSSRNAAYATEALGYIADGMASNADDFTFWFTETPSENSPIYQFADQRGDVSSSVYFMGLLANDNDPREYIFEPFSGNTRDDYAGKYYGQPAGPVELMTYTELMYIAAEAAFAGNDDAGAKNYLKLALNSSIDKYRGMDDDYDAAADAFVTAKEAEIDNATLTLEYIMMQKYVSRFLSPESYNDYRRTGYPAITPSGIQDNVPTRYPYPTNERLYNSNTPSSTKNTPVWWDND